MWFQHAHVETMTSFWQYLNADQQHDLQGVTDGLAEQFSELISRGHSIADLLSHFAEDFGHLPAERLTTLHQARRRFLGWSKRKQQLESSRAVAKLPPVPDEAYNLATSPDQLDAVFRAARLCPRSEYPTDRAWLVVLKAGLELWQRCLGTVRKRGTIRCDAADAAHPQAATYDDYLRTSETIEKVAPHRWLAMRRGEREGAIKLELQFPDEQLLEQMELVRSRLEPPAKDRTTESLLDELVRDDLPSWMRQLLDTEAEAKAITAASASLGGLLRAAPVQSRRLGAVYVTKTRAPVATVVSDRDGEAVAHKAIRGEGPWIGKIVSYLQGQGVQQVVLPTGAPAAEALAELEAALHEAGMQIYKIRTAALAEARLPLTSPPRRLGASVASALVLARRALDPLREWSAVDPVSIGIAEYQNDLDTERLRIALRQTVELCRLERRRGASSSMGASVPRGSAAMARLNPLVKTLADLRAGMSINGVVTNISHFGAFINIGLPQEGLAHISELADEYVSDPNEVVSIGQQVTAHVLQLDPARGRISLSLKTQRRPMLESRGGRSGGGTREPPKQPPKSKAEALASLERLFKK